MKISFNLAEFNAAVEHEYTMARKYNGANVEKYEILNNFIKRIKELGSKKSREEGIQWTETGYVRMSIEDFDENEIAVNFRLIPTAVFDGFHWVTIEGNE